MAELHCSACDAVIPAGAKHCPGCGLQLTAQAVPAVYVTKPRFSIGAIALLAVFGFVLLCWLASDFEHRSSTAHAAAITTDLEPGGALSTPEGFQSRCGKASEIKHTGAGVELFYSANDALVIFPPQGAPQFALRVNFTNGTGRPDSYDKPEDASYAMKGLPCAR